MTKNLPDMTNLQVGVMMMAWIGSLRDLLLQAGATMKAGAQECLDRGAKRPGGGGGGGAEEGTD